jgi:hypothetical protein
MKDNTAIHSLARAGVKSGKIRFIHFRDGKEHTFYSCVNDLTGDRMSAFDNDPPAINDPLPWIQGVFKDIRKKATKVIDCIGDF